MGFNLPDASSARRLDAPLSGLRRIAAVALLVPALAAWGATGTRIDTTYYKIGGRSHAELLASIKRNGPRNGFAYGMGIIEFFPHFTTAIRDGLCRIEKVETAMTVYLRLPKWNGPRDAPRSVIRTAAYFERVIRAHEMQHVAIAKVYQRRFDSSLRRMSPDQSCWTLRREAYALVIRIKKQHVAAQRAFDNRTRKQIKRLI